MTRNQSGAMLASVARTAAALAANFWPSSTAARSGYPDAASAMATRPERQRAPLST